LKEEKEVLVVKCASVAVLVGDDMVEALPKDSF
jgi:hypothetical protein